MGFPSYWILASYYAIHFAVIGTWIPYWPLYLESLGHDAHAIGYLIAITMVVRMFTPPIWGHMADRGSRRRIIIATSTGGAAAFALFYLGTSFGFLLVVTGLYSIFHSGPLALVEATSMEQAARHKSEYGTIRVWGSIGFIIASLLMGAVTDHWGVHTVLPIILGLLIVGALLVVKIPEAEPHDVTPHSRNPLRLFQHKGVLWFYLSAMLMQFSHGAYYGFLSLHLEHNGFSRTAIGLLWALGVLSEVMVMTHSRKLFAHLGVSAILMLSLLLASLRWSIFAVTIWWPLLLVAQLLHAFTFGAFHIAGVRRTFESAPQCSRATAQAWYGALSFGLGGSMGLVLSGTLYERSGAQILYAIMAGIAFLGLLASWRSAHLFRLEEKTP